ncbi:MAG TPA: MarR family transcriptional regulator [Tepidisphaeraceae bacterium]|jgi:DNA-binding MarR family transcriptional regulator
MPDVKPVKKEASGRLRSAEQATFLNIQKTADILMGELADLLKPHALSPTQYNVLRILRAAGPDGLACGKISDRMLTREPDMTRLLDRLEKRELLTRSRDASDRRVVRASITKTGLGLLERLDQPIADLHRTQLGHLGREKLKLLADLLETARART